MESIKNVFEGKYNKFEKSIEKKMEELASSINFEFKEMEEKIHKTEIEINSKFDKKIEDLEYKVSILEATVNKFERDKFKNDVLIFGLPGDVENPKELTLKLIDKLNANINSNEILNVKLLKKKTNKNTMLVEFRSHESKKMLMTSKKHYKQLFAKNLGLKTENNNEIYIRNHLTNFQTHLYFQTKHFKNTHNFRFLWTKDGRILLRENEGSKVFEITCEQDLKNISNTFRSE